MHGLTAQEILKLARCSRYLLHAADAPFAWQYTRIRFDATPESSSPSPPLPPISLPRRIIGWCRKMLPANQKPPPIETPRLSRHAKVTIKWWKQLMDSHLGVLAIASRVAAVYELDASWLCSYDPTYTTSVLRSPSMRQLRVLSMADYNYIHLDVMQAIVQMPYLHTLCLLEYAASFNVPGTSNIELLSLAPALTSLNIQDSYTTYSSRLVQVAECSNLVDLSVSRPWLYGPAWPVFFAHPHIQQLHSLKLNGFCARGQLPLLIEHAATTQQEFQISFAGMHNLHTLHLANCHHIDLMLPALAHAPALHHLTITPSLNMGFWYREMFTAPSTLVLATLLVAAPRLHCVLVLVPPDERSIAMGLRLKKKFESDAVLSAAAARFTIQSD